MPIRMFDESSMIFILASDKTNQINNRQYIADLKSTFLDISLIRLQQTYSKSMINSGLLHLKCVSHIWLSTSFLTV